MRAYALSAAYLFFITLSANAQSYPHNAMNCEHCHALPLKFGSSPLTVARVGRHTPGGFIPGPEGGVVHRYAGSPVRNYPPDGNTAGLRVIKSVILSAAKDCVLCLQYPAPFRCASAVRV